MKNDTSTALSRNTLTPAALAVRAPESPSAAHPVLYDTQAACLVFCCGIVFKVSSLPGLVSDKMHSGTLWLYLFMIAVDLACFAAVACFASRGSADVLSRADSLSFRVFSALVAAWLALKGFVYFAYTVVFLMVDLFAVVPPFVVVVILALPVLYLGTKGLRGIARCAELFTPVLFLILLGSLAFLETDLDVGRNLPLAAMPADEFFARGLRFGMWTGDFLPLLFVRLERKRKFPVLPVGAGVSYALVAVIALLAVAMYGEALPYAYNILIRLSAFNRLSLEIGRLEWAAIFVVIVMAMLSLSLHMWGASEGCRRAFGTPVPARVLFSAAVIVIPIALPSLHEVIDFSTGTFGYIAFAFTVAVSAAALLLARKAKRAAKEDSPISPEEEDRDTPVSVPPELPEESGASAPTLPVPEHGEKKRTRGDKGGGDA